MNHNDRDRVLLVLSGTPKTSGKRNEIALGQIGLLNTTDGQYIDPIKKGSLGNNKLQLVLGGGNGRKTLNSVPFLHQNITLQGIEHPSPVKEHHIILGNTGYSNKWTIPFEFGKTTNVTLNLTGEMLSLLGIEAEEFTLTASEYVPMPDDSCDADPCPVLNCAKHTKSLINKLLKTRVGNGFVSDIMSIAPIISCDNSSPTLLDVNYWTLTICGTGSNEELSNIQSQYGNGVSVQSVSNGTAVYVMQSTNTPSDYTSGQIYTPLFDCMDCPNGYSFLEGGYKYTVTLEDDGVDSTALLAVLPNLVGGSNVKVGQKDGVGTYVFITKVPLTSTDIDTFMAIGAVQATASFNAPVKVSSMCLSVSPDGISWVKGDACTQRTFDFFIQLHDKCKGQSRLGELQSAYPNLSIVEVNDKNCFREYKATVVSNVVCPEQCHVEMYTADTPHSYDGENWYLAEEAEITGECFCGISIKAKPFNLIPPVCLYDKVGVIKPDLRFYGGIGSYGDVTALSSETVSERIKETVVQLGSVGTGWGYDLASMVIENYDRQTGVTYNGQAEAFFRNNGIDLDLGKQYSIASVHVTRVGKTGAPFNNGYADGFNYQLILSQITPTMETWLDQLA